MMTDGHMDGVEDGLTQSSTSSLSNERIVKFEAQLYKSRDGSEYVLDFQRLQGELFLFVDLCSGLLSSIRV